MIDPNNIINYNRTTSELEELILFLVAVAGKNAATTSKNLDRFLSDYCPFTPFKVVKLFHESKLKDVLRHYGFGCYNRLARAFTELAESNLDLRTCTLEDLMQIHGIGRKSASCFLAWTREMVNVAMLDTHLMKYIRHELGYTDAPKATPSTKKQYDFYEKIYLDHCSRLQVNPTYYDLEIWRSYANK